MSQDDQASGADGPPASEKQGLPASDAEKAVKLSEPRFLADHPTLRLISVCIGILASGATLVVYAIVPLVGVLAGSSSLKTSATPTASASLSPPATPRIVVTESRPQGHVTSSSPATTFQRLAVGTCLDAKIRVTLCTETHRLEVVSLPGSQCTDEALVTFLGGTPMVDLLVVAPKLMRLSGGGDYCVTGPAPGIELAVAWKGSLLAVGPMADAWRRCTSDADNDDRVPCSEPHTGEYMGLRSGSSDCVNAFDQYARTQYSQDSDFLSLERVQPSGTSVPACLAGILGHNLLTASLRNIRTSALPIIAG